MRNSDYQFKLHRGSTPRHEMGQGLDGHPGDRVAVRPGEVLGCSVPLFVDRLHRPDQLPDIR